MSHHFAKPENALRKANGMVMVMAMAMVAVIVTGMDVMNDCYMCL